MTQSSASAGADLSPSEARARQRKGAWVVDVREDDEWAAGHAAGATHIPLGQVMAREAELPRDRDVLFICGSGSRSGRATQLLLRAGHPRVFNIEGGTKAWLQAGLPIDR